LSTSIRRSPRAANSFSAAFTSELLPVPARTGEEHVVGGAAGHELRGVVAQAPLLLVDVLQVREADRVRMAHRLEVAAAARALAPAVGVRLPVGRGGRGRQQALQARDELVQAPGDALPVVAHRNVNTISQ